MRIRFRFTPIYKKIANAIIKDDITFSNSGGSGGPAPAPSPAPSPAGNTSGFIGLPVGNTAQRVNIVGGLRINSETSYLEFYDGNSWSSVKYIGTP